MPGGNRTGPMGFGPMTGKGRGWCARPAQGYGPGRTNMLGWGRGGGWRHRCFATGVPGGARYGWGSRWGGPPSYGGAPAAADDLYNLKEYAAGLEEELSNIKARMVELERDRKTPTVS